MMRQMRRHSRAAVSTASVREQNRRFHPEWSVRNQRRSGREDIT